MEMHIIMPRRVTIDTNLCIFQHKILNNVLYLNEKLFEFLKLFLDSFALFVIRKIKPIYTFFTLAIKQNLFGLNYKRYWTQKYFFHKILNSEILLSQSAFFDFPDNKENFEIINHLHLLFKYYLFKLGDTRKISLEGLKKNIIRICNIEKQICSNNSKKETKFFWRMAYNRKPIKMNEIYCKNCLDGGW